MELTFLQFNWKIQEFISLSQKLNYFAASIKTISLIFFEVLIFFFENSTSLKNHKIIYEQFSIY